ncbi:MAG: putative repeat protein (TIGR01451 family) [Crocinitomix sp.]|jgi:uncharacterized repeat protein (TIGR01451 family)
MKKIDLMLKFLFIFTLVNVSYGQEGPYFGGPTCATAVPIEVGEGYITNDFEGDDWYYFVAPCDGDLEITNCIYGDNKQTTIYSGSCGSLVAEKTADGDDCSTNDIDGAHVMSAGDTVFIQMDDIWDEDDIEFDIVFENPECPYPTSVTCFATEWDEILIAWFAGGSETDWLVIYGLLGFDPDVEGDTILVAGGPTVTLSDLDELTCYDYYIVANCGLDIVSCLGTRYTCCTSDMCAGPIAITPNTITYTSFNATWEDGSGDSEFYEIEWGFEGFELGTGTFVGEFPFETYDFIGLDGFECYEFYVRANCGIDGYSEWIGPTNVCTVIDSADLDLEGIAYFDENENGLQDLGEPGLNAVPLLSDPSGILSFTGGDGHYFSSTYFLDDGVYEIYPILEHWEVSSDSLVYTIVVDDTFEPRDSLDFGLYPDTLIHELNAELIGGLPRCHDTINYWVHFQNTGTTIASGFVHVELDDSLYYVTADILPDSVVGQHVYWNYEDLFYFDDILIALQVGTPDGEADDLLSNLTVTIDSLGTEVFSVTESLDQTVLCAFDPNDKTPTPLGDGEFGNIPPDTESIEYLVRFQNTGTDTAFKVVIRDQLDPNINWHSLTPLASSHEMTIELGFDGEVSFIFNDIMLPDSNINEVASHGFVKYKVKLNEGLSVGTSIYNTANIYFDFNPAVVTNTTVNTLYLDDVSIAELTKDQQILVYPNPFSESTTVYFGEGLSENSSLQIVDLLGSQVYFMDRISGNSVEIQASKFNSGLYILILQDLNTNEIYTKRLVVN